MSYSITKTGKPQEIVAELQQYSSQLSGESKKEFDAALPHLVSLIQQNYADEANSSYKTPTLKLEAWGSGVEIDGKVMNRECSVKLVIVT